MSKSPLSCITLGIETSCDETALSLLETRQNNEGKVEYRILGNIINSQIDLHREFGGVFPMLAKREHIKNLPILYEKLIIDSGVSETDITQVAVTQGPGLEPALWTGILFAKELAEKLEVPIIPINHMEGHIVSALFNTTEIEKDFESLKEVRFPALAILISGGHTEIVKVHKLGSYEILGSTVDDAIGEAFDKVARMLQLPYPGGPEISRLAEQARKESLPQTIKLPRPMIHSKDLKFSFSGLKTSVLYLLREIGENITIEQKKEIAREFEDAVTEVMISKTELAISENETHSLIIGGGVIANTHIRKAFEALANKHSLSLYLPGKGLTGDNALMIALAGSLNLNTIKPSEEGLIAKGNLSL